MSIIKGIYPHLAHYISSQCLMSFQEDSIEINDSCSKQTIPVDRSTFITSLAPNIQHSIKKSVRWHLRQGFIPTLKNEGVELSSVFCY